MKRVEEKIEELEQELKKRSLTWDNPSGKGTSTVLRTTEKKIVYQRRKTLFYFPKKVAIKTFKDFKENGKIHARELIAFDKAYRQKKCHCTFFMLLMQYFHEAKIKRDEIGFYIELNEKEE